MIRDNIGFVFSGQGSQKIGMLANLAKTSSVVQETFSEASDVLSYDMWHLVQQGSQEELNLTEKTQPVLLTASVAIWRVWNATEGVPMPRLMAGHSLGEYSALVAAGVIAFSDAVKLVELRGRFMQQAVPKGAGGMAAVIGLDGDTISSACRDAALDEVVAPVNFNAPDQVVIAGTAAAVNRAVSLCKDAGAKKVLHLPVSAPFHTDLMRPAAEQLKSHIAAATFSEPNIPVVQNVHASIETQVEKIKALLVEQIYRPVQWVNCVKFMSTQGIAALIECGPGKVLCGLNRRIDKSIPTYSIEESDLIKKAAQALA